MARAKKNQPSTAKANYKPTDREKAVLAEHLARLNAASAAPSIKIIKGEMPKVSPDHPNYAIGYGLLMEALGTGDYDFGQGLIHQLVNAGSQGSEISEAGVNFMLSVVKGIKPRDQLEAMLAAQMAAIHVATMTFARRLAHVGNIAQQDSAERALSKLARTYVTQMEALKRYRTGGEQKVTVQHVSVSEGGQAIVGNVTQGAPAPQDQGQASTTPALTDNSKPAMPIIGDNEQAPMPMRRKRNDRQSST